VNKSPPVPPLSAFAPFTDPQAVHALLRTHVQAFFGTPQELVRCDVLHAWRKTYERPNSWDKSYMNVCYRLHLRGSAPALMHGTAFYHHRGEPGALTHGAALATLQVAEIDLALRRFPDDAGLPQLALLADTTKLLEYVPCAVLRELALVREVRLEVVNYRPGERCTLRYDIELDPPGRGLSLFAKTYKDATGASVHGHLLELYSRTARTRDSATARTRDAAMRHPKVRVAEPLGYDSSTRTVWQRGAQGQRPSQLFESGERFGGAGQDGAVRAMARSLCALHEAGLTYERVILRERLVFEARKRANKLGAAFKALAANLQQVVQRCAEQRLSLPAGEAALLHGDAHINQFLIDGGEAVMFDFDELTWGDAEHDLANFIISLQLDTPTGTQHRANATTATEQRAIESFLQEYRQHAARRVDPALLLWHYRVQLISKAYRAFWRQAPHAQASVERAVALASEEMPAWLQ
jgi:thiamine kinase-like enzyme